MSDVQKLVTSKIQYAVKTAGRAMGERYVSSTDSNTHFSFMGYDVEEAKLFETATEAEAKTKAGREGVSWLAFFVVPVKVTTTTLLQPATSTTREILS